MNMLIVLLQAVTEDESSIKLNYIGLFCVFVLCIWLGDWLLKKASLNITISLGTSVFLVVFPIIVMNMKNGFCNFQVPTLPIIAFESIFILSGLICFFRVIYLYKRIIKKLHKTDDDIKQRQRLIRNISYLLAITLTAVPYFLNSWGLHDYFPSLDPQPILTQEGIVFKLDANIFPQFINFGMKTALFITIVVFLADNILNRIASEIYTYDDIKDLDKFCLYLRSFNNDKNKEEKLICEMTRNLYPVYAIGDPNKILQPNGAERIYVTDEIWQDAVKDLSERSKLILLRIGQTDGTKWEIANIIKSNLIKKVIFIAYNQEDYNYFSNKIHEKIGTEIPLMDFSSQKPNAFYIVEDNGSLIVKHHIITKSKDVENMLNEYLKTYSQLDEEYSKDLDLREHNLKYIFDKSRIPESVRKSLNWGIISPIVNMRHWSLVVWGIFMLFLLLSGVIMSPIPAYFFAFVMLLLGNRIEWAAGGWSCASLFLKHQRREAKLIWLSLILGVLYSIVYMFLHITLMNIAVNEPILFM